MDSGFSAFHFRVSNLCFSHPILCFPSHPLKPLRCTRSYLCNMYSLVSIVSVVGIVSIESIASIINRISMKSILSIASIVSNYFRLHPSPDSLRYYMAIQNARRWNGNSHILDHLVKVLAQIWHDIINLLQKDFKACTFHYRNVFVVLFSTCPFEPNLALRMVRWQRPRNGTQSLGRALTRTYD